MHKTELRTLLATLVLLLVGCASADAPADRHILWQIKGKTHNVYLLGSVHLLRAEDYPLPQVFDDVYAASGRLVMELDMDDLDPAAIGATMHTAGMIADGNTLQSLLGAQRWREAETGAANIGIKLSNLSAAEPWFAALTIIEIQMMKLHYDQRFGIENYFTTRAAQDHKPITGLETVQQQVVLFDSLPMATQLRFLLKTISDAAMLSKNLGRLISAWKNGDTHAMDRELVDSFEGFPEVYESLVVRRNSVWATEVEQMLDDPQHTLVIVGALHLVGPDSVVALLRSKGYRVEQM